MLKDWRGAQQFLIRTCFQGLSLIEAFSDLYPWVFVDKTKPRRVPIRKKASPRKEAAKEA